MDHEIDNSGVVAGLAALAICESLLLALAEQKVLSRRDTLGVLVDAAAVHCEVRAVGPQETANRQLAANLIDRIIADLRALPRT